MNTRRIRRCGTGYVVFALFIYIFSWQIPIFIAASMMSKYKFDISAPLGFILIVIYMGLMFLDIYYFTERMPRKHGEKLVRQFREHDFKDAFYYKYRDDYCLIDESNGRIGVVTKSNPFKFQILDAALIQQMEIMPLSYQREQPHLYEFGVSIWMEGKKYLIYTYNGYSGGRTITYINLKTKTAQDALNMADQLAWHIQNAREVAIRKQDAIGMRNLS